MAISARNEYYQVWQDFLDGKYVLCITNEIIEEYSEVIARNISPLLSEFVISTIINRKNVVMKSPSYAFHLIKADEDDNKFVDCAIIANAKYIVSNDRHFDVLREIPFPKVDVIKINQFLLDLQNAAETM
ncbi:MAG: PIN domain-containing protein [Prevotella sp.]|nr:PIN domain-containing protein [Prevotella sp.]MCI6764911.1 PIN domain-containing protein [Prevotella sp.]